ncbi:Aspartate aminotransferase P2 [Scenedesmus sp. PABB004]|nr:Aspartate aminotransferase P2 [Scenedesmus sp. PABB004]
MQAAARAPLASRRGAAQAAGGRGAPAPARLRAAGASRLAGVEMAPPDPILGVSEAFRASTSPNKLNLGVGAYRTEELQPLVLEVVKKAEAKMLAAGYNKEYLPIEGLDAFRTATAQLLLGGDSPAVKDGRVAVLQALSGTGSLRVGAAFIARFMPGTTVYISNPTWGNHRNIFGDEGVEWKYYRYFDADTVGLDFEGMTADLNAAPDGSIVLLHGCAHNPTGVDPTPEQWQAIADLCKAKGHMPFFDVAYQGFATGDLDKDAFAPRLFVESGLEVMVAQSYSKNLGLYGERVGALNVVLSDADVRAAPRAGGAARGPAAPPPAAATARGRVAPHRAAPRCAAAPQAAKAVLSQLKRLARAIWSNPPTHGARIAAEVVGDPAMFELWKSEMAAMAGRIAGVRGELQAALTERCPERDWSFVTRQIGMFSFTGMTPAQVDNMTNKHAVYMTRDGRISLAGLSSAKVPYLADAIVDSVRNA